MEWAALIAWVLTAGAGFVLLVTWLARGGMRQPDTSNRIGPAQIMSHFLLAATGLVLWIIYIATDSDALAWISVVLLVVVAVIGFTMFAIWLRRRRGTALETVTPDTPAEQHFPVSVVVLHGLLAVTTLALVFLTAVGVGES